MLLGLCEYFVFSIFFKKVCEMLINFDLQKCFWNVMLKNECSGILWLQILCDKIWEKWVLIHIV
jgi:hypothetical protein